MSDEMLIANFTFTVVLLFSSVMHVCLLCC